MTHRISSTISWLVRSRDILVVFFGSTAILSSVVYAVLLYGTISNVIARDVVQRETRVLSSEVINLESEYFAKKTAVTLQVATERGFIMPQHTAFVSQQAVTALRGAQNEFSY